MPVRARRPCAKVGCPRLNHGDAAYCEQHIATHSPAEKRKQHDQRRGSRHERGYGYQWSKLRRMILARDPVCRWKENGVHVCFKPSTDCDHILPKSQGGTDEENNLQGLCHEHHSVKTAREDGGLGHAVKPRASDDVIII